METHYLQDGFCLIIFAAAYISFLECLETNEKCFSYIPLDWDDGIKNNSLTNSWCIQYCNQKNNGYKYAGTKVENCYCRKNYLYIPSTDLENCKQTCPDSSNGYFDCYPSLKYPDYGGNAIEIVNITNAGCVEYCRSSYYSFAVTRNNECYCRIGAPDSSFKADVALCNYRCSGKSSTYCGGGDVSTFVTVSLIGKVSIKVLNSVVQEAWRYESDPGGNIKDPITSNSSTINKYEGSTITNPSLTTKNVHLTDQGEYRCYARNKLGENTSNMLKLSVIETSDPSKSATATSDSQTTVKQSERSTHISTKSKADTTYSSVDTVSITQSITDTTDSSVDTISNTQSKTDNTDSLATPVTNTQKSVTPAGVRPKRLLCTCPKRYVNTKWHFLDGKDISDAVLRNLVLEDFEANIKPLISVKKKNVSKAIRKRTSAENLRRSAQSVGSGLSVLLIVPVALILAADLSRCFYSIRKTNYRNKTTKKCKKSGLPPQTVIKETESFDHDDLSTVSKRVQQAIGFGNKPSDHQPRDTCDIHMKEASFHAYPCDESEIEDKSEMSLSTSRHKCNSLCSVDSNPSGNRKRIIFSSDEATPECDLKKAGYELRCNRSKRQRKGHKKRKDEVYC
ncbi:Hypothetical predicted protein [Mytilus galloprovincialis]|uniref:WSC domain-containing protein n=1 Tax=Mytilus galloprovincialis TaxID=29158 RepID=A0A8B6H2K7_MYTGA|nr:Hypothetical predicted protein [Mytilus galloprovincialis]